MRRLIIIAFAGCVMLAACAGSKNAQLQTRSERKDARSYKKELKAAANTRIEHRRIARENERQIKKMTREAIKQNRGRYDGNSLGNVFGDM